ncbi:MAG: ABC transporter ATP-binding protein, partial [Bdellovibrionales bacterium]|nr:ABC transporter ATP-binding protein [Bdellovibrionales bacterium]
SVSMNIYPRALRYLTPYRGQFVAALICMVLFGASDGGIPFLIKYILDGIFDDRNTQLLTLLPILLIAFTILRSLFDFLQQYLMARLGHTIVRDVRSDINTHILSLSPSFFIRRSSGDMLSRLTSDVMLVKGLLTDSVSSIIRDSIRVVALLATAVYLDPFLAAIAFIAFPLAIYPIYRFGRRVRKFTKRGQDATGALSALMQESIVGSKVVQVFGREAYEQERFEGENARLTDAFIKSDMTRAFTSPVNEILGSLAVSGVILYGGYSVIGGVRSQGDFIAFLASVFLMYEPFKKLSRVYNNIQQGMSGAERIFELLDEKPSIVNPPSLTPLRSVNEIVFDGVSFTYEGGEGQVLKNISVTVPEGKKVALVGFSGAGKSTFVDLIPRFIDPSAGRVTIGGIDVRKVALEELRSRIAMVDQHTFLFHDTIRQNIAYGKPDASEEEVHQAARAAYAYDFIMKLPKGFDTVVGESGLTLSGGERQRVAIARAILKDAPILILDEATASLDNRSEREVQKALEALERERTSVVIAHRLSTVHDADCIVVLRDGAIVEMGTHQELLDKKGEYERLYTLQFNEQPSAAANEG